MSDNKKYYYMRLKEDFFDSEALKILEGLPDGYMYSNILLKIYLKSLKLDGKLMYNDRIPYNSTMLSSLTGHQVGTIEKAMQLFRDLDLIEILDNGTIYMLDIQSLIGKSSTEADRKREYRQRIEEEKKLLEQGNGQMSGQMLPENRDKSLDTRDKSLENRDINNKDKNKNTNKLTNEQELSTAEKDRIKLLSELFVGWSVNDYQILYLSSLVNERLPMGAGEMYGRDIAIYDALFKLTKKAKAENVKNIYRWLEVVIPNWEF